LPVCLSVCLSVCLFVCMPVCPFVCVFACLRDCLFVYLFVCIFACLSVHFSVCLSVHLSVSLCLSVCLLICLCLSVCLSISSCEMWKCSIFIPCHLITFRSRLLVFQFNYPLHITHWIQFCGKNNGLTIGKVGGGESVLARIFFPVAHVVFSEFFSPFHQYIYFLTFCLARIRNFYFSIYLALCECFVFILFSVAFDGISLLSAKQGFMIYWTKRKRWILAILDAIFREEISMTG